MNALTRLEELPDWPGRMSAPVAAAYMGISEGSFLDRFGAFGVKKGGNRLWAKAQLDQFIARQFAIEQPAPPSTTPMIGGRLGSKEETFGLHIVRKSRPGQAGALVRVCLARRPQFHRQEGGTKPKITPALMTAAAEKLRARVAIPEDRIAGPIAAFKQSAEWGKLA